MTPSGPGSLEPQRHIIVHDCNVYLDVASIVGPPFSWVRFDAEAARLASAPLPHPVRGNDSLRAIAVCTSGRFAGSETLEVWTNAHIDTVVYNKARASTTPDPETGYRGLGWSDAHARSLVEDLIHGLTARSNGGSLGSNYPDGNPPLDHEDGMVFGACRVLASDDPLSKVYCVTRDRAFIEAADAGSLSTHSRVVSPTRMVQAVRAARSTYSTRAMRPDSRP